MNYLANRSRIVPLVYPIFITTLLLLNAFLASPAFAGQCSGSATCG